MLTIEKQSNQEKWAMHIEVQENSGQSQKRWCTENQISYYTFRYWRQRLKKRNAVNNKEIINEESFEFAEVKIQPEEKNRSTIDETYKLKTIELKMGDIVLKIPPTYDDEFLIRLIRTLNRL